jgi:hypothetical protein
VAAGPQLSKPTGQETRQTEKAACCRRVTADPQDPHRLRHRRPRTAREVIRNRPWRRTVGRGRNVGEIGISLSAVARNPPGRQVWAKIGSPDEPSPSGNPRFARSSFGKTNPICEPVSKPRKLAEQVGLFDVHPEADLVAGAVLEWRSWQGGPDERVPSGPVHDRVLERGEATTAVYPLGCAQAPCPSNFMVRRALFDAVGGFEESFRGPMQMYEDQAFLSKAYLAGRPYFCDHLWVKYRIHDQSCMAMYKPGHYDQTRRRFLQWLSGYLKETRVRSPRIWMALWRAELPYRNPRLHAVVQNSFVRKLYHGLGRGLRVFRQGAAAGRS